MSFTDRKPFVVTEDLINACWSGVKKSKDLDYHPVFRCQICGHKFKLNDVARFVFCNYGNFFVCQKCDDYDDFVRQKFMKIYDESKESHWWLWNMIRSE